MGWALKAETWNKIEAAQVSSYGRTMARMKRQGVRMIYHPGILG